MIQYKRIGEMLLEANLITQEQLDLALRTKMGSSLRFGEVLTGLGFVTEEEVTDCLAEQYNYPVVDPWSITPEPEALAVVPSIVAIGGLVLPVEVTPEVFRCVIADPLDLPMTDSLFRLAARPVEFSLAPPSDLYDAILAAYENAAELATVPDFVVHTVDDAPPAPQASPFEQPRQPRRKPKVKLQEDRLAILTALADSEGS